MSYTVAYLKAWTLPYGKQTPFPPTYYSNPPSPGSPAPIETSYIEPISFYTCTINLIPGWLYFQFRVNTRYWVEGNWVRLTTSKSLELGLYYASFECFLSQSSHWLYLYTFDIAEFPHAIIQTRPWSEESTPQIAGFPAAESTSHYHEGEHENWLIYSGFRFRHPYVLTPPTLSLPGVSTTEAELWRKTLGE